VLRQRFLVWRRPCRSKRPQGCNKLDQINEHGTRPPGNLVIEAVLGTKEVELTLVRWLGRALPLPSAPLATAIREGERPADQGAALPAVFGGGRGDPNLSWIVRSR
jgi:hypothetical protein